MENINRIYAYMRISTTKKTQKTDRQKYTIEQYAKANNFKVYKFFSDKITGGTKADERPNFHLMKEQLREGDVVIFSDVDRLGRDADDITSTSKELQNMRVRVVILDVPFLNEWETVYNDSLYKMVIDILITLKAHMAQQEKEKTHERVMQGLETAKAKGKRLGRPSTGVPSKFKREYNKFLAGDYGTLKVVDFCKLQNIALSTYYKYRAMLEQEKQEKEGKKAC